MLRATPLPNTGHLSIHQPPKPTHLNLQSAIEHHKPHIMIPSLRARSPLLLRHTVVRTYSSVTQVSANDPKADRPLPPNVSATNETPSSSEGSFDQVLVETVEEAEKMRTLQAPNRKGIWSRSQQPRERAMVGPRFEQTIMADQVCQSFRTVCFGT
jgi:hypothetical protein